MAFRHDNAYYLGGVVSSKEQFGDNAVALFTDVRSHIDWVTQIYNDFSRVPFNQTRICSKHGNSNPTYRKLCSSKYCAVLVKLINCSESYTNLILKVVSLFYKYSQN